jgi:hypothetical protein
MQLSDAPSKLPVPFANTGSKNTIPLSVGVLPNSATLEAGFPPITRVDIVAGGVPPDGLDMNGILFESTAINQWSNAGAGYVYDSVFATSIGGYPQGSLVLATDGYGYWLNQVDDNTTDPEAFGAGWVPDSFVGNTLVTMTGSNVTLTALEAARPTIVISGALVSNLNLILPTWEKQWTVVNDCTGAFSITVKTSGGTGVALATTEKAIVYGDGTNIYEVSGTGGGGGGSTYAGFINRLKNPRGNIYQRTVAATSDDGYFADCWYILSQTGSVTPSQLTDPEDGYPTGIRITQSQVAAQRFGFAQIIEGADCKDLRGGSGTLVPRIRVSTGQAIRYAILGWTGTQDAVTSDVVNDWTNSTYTAGNFFISSNLSVIAVGAQTPTANTWTSLSAITSTLGSTFNNIIIFVWTEGTAAQNFTLDFDYVQFEGGITASAFENRPYAEEYDMAQRYLMVYGYMGLGISLTAQHPSSNLVFPTRMRAAPTLLAGASYTVGAPPNGTPALNSSDPLGVAFYNSDSNWTTGNTIFVTCLLSAEL